MLIQVFCSLFSHHGSTLLLVKGAALDAGQERVSIGNRRCRHALCYSAIVLIHVCTLYSAHVLHFSNSSLFVVVISMHVLKYTSPLQKTLSRKSPRLYRLFCHGADETKTTSKSETIGHVPNLTLPKTIVERISSLLIDFTF